MLTAIENSVDIELLIEGNRDFFFKKISGQNPLPPRPADIVNSPSQSSEAIETPDPSGQIAMAYRYRVQESYLLDQERVFRVRFHSSEYHYYAFEFKGYIVLPAFLAASFEISKYACLNVIIASGLGLCYIFVEKDPNIPDNHISKVLDDHSDYFKEKEYDFNIPSNRRKVMNLHIGNKDLISFLDWDNLKKNGPERTEWRKLASVKTLDTPQKTKIPFYRYLPSNIVNDFSIRHKKFFDIGTFSPFGTSMIHEKSESFLEITNLENESNTPKDNSEFIIQSLQEIFINTSYKREKYILDQLVNHIKNNYQKGKDGMLGNFYCSMIAILQSSGYGKSKLMERLGSRTPTFYSSLQYGIGFPRESVFLSRLIKELEDIIYSGIKDHQKVYYMSNFSTAVYIYILRIIFIILKKKNEKPLEENFQIDDIKSFEIFSHIQDVEKNELIFKLLFEDLKMLCANDKPVEFKGVDPLRLKDIDTFPGISLNEFAVTTSLNTNNLEEEVMLMLGKISIENNGLPSVFVIDEAKGLRFKKPTKEAAKSGKKCEKYNWRFRDWNADKNGYDDIKERAPYNIFRRTFRMFITPWKLLTLIIISTSGQISVPLPELDLDPSRREATSLNFMENFALVQTYNVNSEEAKSIHADMFPKGKINDWIQFLDSDFRKEEFFKNGRPLIYGTFIKNLKNDPFNIEKTFEECNEFQFLGQKLFGGKEYKRTEDMATLCGMFNFAFGVNYFPPHIKKEELVENYLMTLVKYFDKEGKCFLSGCYLPEGPFNALSSMYYVKYPESLCEIISDSIKYGLCDVGQLGELLAQYILLQTAFTFLDDSVQKIRKLIFKPISLLDFLMRLAGSQVDAITKFFSENTELAGSKISFSYFENFPTKPILAPFNLMARCLFKGSALTLSRGYPGIDLMIPLVLRNGQVSFFGVQVKFVQQRSVGKEVKDAVPNMEFTKMFYARNQNCPFGLMIFALGDYQFGKENPEVLRTRIVTPEKKSINAPSILVFEGIPDSFKLREKDFFKLVPERFTGAYRGVNTALFEVCDQLEALTTDIFPEKQTGSKRTKSEQKEFGKMAKRQNQGLVSEMEELNME